MDHRLRSGGIGAALAWATNGRRGDLTDPEAAAGGINTDQDRAALTHFGGWGNAIRAAGFQPPPRERWSKKRVLERLHAWHEHCGASNLRDVDPNLSAAAARMFGSYHAALEAAGIEPPTRYWTDARVLAAIQDRYIAGNPLHIEGLGDLRLSQAAKRLFGSWQAAVEAAGLIGKIPIKKPLRRWTPEQVQASSRSATFGRASVAGMCAGGSMLWWNGRAGTSPASVWLIEVTDRGTIPTGGLRIMTVVAGLPVKCRMKHF